MPPKVIYPRKWGTDVARAAKGEGSAFKTANGYRGYVTVNGKRKYFSARTKAEAAQKKRLLLTQRDGGELSTGRTPTLKAWLDHHLQQRMNDNKPLRPSTAAVYRNYISHYVDPVLGGVKLDKLTIDQLEAFYASLRDRGLTGSTIHQCHSIIRAALKHAVWRGHVSRNVAALVQPPSVGKSDAVSLSDADLAEIIAAATGDVYEARWRLSLDLGLRPGEAIAVEWPDIDFDNRTIHVHQQLHQIPGAGVQLIPLPKTERGDRVLVLPKYLAMMLAERREAQLAEMIAEGDLWQAWEWEGVPRALAFTQQSGQPVRPRLDATKWARLLERAGVPHIRRYTARHTAASGMIADGVDPATVAKTLGHANPAFTMATYVHAIDERITANADRLDAKHKVQNKVQDDQLTKLERLASQ